MTNCRLVRFGPIETIMANKHANYAGTSQVVTAVKLDACLDPDRVAGSYRAYCRKTYPLSHALTILHGEWHRVLLPEASVPPFAVEMVELDTRCLDAVVCRELNDVLDPAKGVVRLVMLVSPNRESCALILTMNHAVSDTRSAKIVLMSILHGSVRDDPPDGLKAFLPPISQGRKDKPQPVVEECAAPEALLANSSDDAFARALLSLEGTGHRAATGVRTLDVSPVLLARLDTLACELGVRLNTLLTAVTSLSVLRFLGIASAVTHTAVALHPDVLDHDVEISCSIDIVSQPIAIGDLSLAALTIENAIDACIRNTTPLSARYPKVPTLLNPTPLSRQRAIRLCEGIGFTNSGRCDRMLLPSGVRMIEYRSVANRTAGDLLFCFHLSFLNSRGTIGIVYPMLLLDEDAAGRFETLLMETLQAAIVGSSHRMAPNH